MHAEKIPFLYLTIRKNGVMENEENGILHTVFLAVSHQRQIRYLNTGVKVLQNQLVNNQVIDHPAALELNLKLNDMIQELYSFIYRYSLYDSSPQEILNRYKYLRVNTTSFQIYATRTADAMLQAGKYKSGTSLISTLNALRKIDVNIHGFSDLTVQKCNVINSRWEEIGLKINTRGVYFRNIRLLYNRAIIDGFASRNEYPFTQFKIQKQKTAKRNILVSDLQKIITLPLSGSQDCTRDMFLLSLYLIGINFKDLLTIKRSNMINGRLIYYRSKTGKLINIRVEPEARALIEKWKGSDLLINVVEKMKDPLYEKRPLFMDVINRSNQQLKIIARKAGIPVPLSTYYARHTWATLAAKQGVTRDIIGLSLGHSSDSVTDVYIEWDQDFIDQANRLVLDSIKT